LADLKTEPGTEPVRAGSVPASEVPTLPSCNVFRPSPLQHPRFRCVALSPRFFRFASLPLSRSAALLWGSAFTDPFEFQDPYLGTYHLRLSRHPYQHLVLFLLGAWLTLCVSPEGLNLTKALLVDPPSHRTLPSSAAVEGGVLISERGHKVGDLIAHLQSISARAALHQNNECPHLDFL
jgi:hypothetical protein